MIIKVLANSCFYTPPPPPQMRIIQMEIYNNVICSNRLYQEESGTIKISKFFYDNIIIMMSDFSLFRNAVFEFWWLNNLCIYKVNALSLPLSLPLSLSPPSPFLSHTIKFIPRVTLPPEWRGLNGTELCQVTGIPGCVFVHGDGFVGANLTYEGALAMARKALQMRTSGSH